MTRLEEVHARERAVYDERARVADAASRPPADPDGFGEALLEPLGDVEGKRVLELGCGAGDLTAQLVDRGARVTALDLSPAMVELASARLERFRPGANVRWVVAPVEASGLEAASVDAVVGKWVLHHADLRSAADEIERVLRPGGRGAFFENQATNPVLAFARTHLIGRVGTPVGTRDEHPLVEADFAYLRSRFAEVELRYPTFHFFELLSSRALRYRLHRPLRALDALVWRRAPRLRRHSWLVVVTVRKDLV